MLRSFVVLSYDGDMTISLSSGLSIRVPNDQFLVPYVYVDYDGGRKENSSIKDFLWNGVNDQPATLGRYFLTAAYLMVNHDSNSFTIWQANATTSSNLVPVMNEQTAEACGNMTGVVQPSVTPTATATGASKSKASSGSTRVGAIAGGVVGGVAFLAIAGIGAWFLISRKKKDQSQGLPQGQNPIAGDCSAMLEDIHELKGSEEQSIDAPGPYELVGPRGPEAHELPPDDRPRELAGREADMIRGADGYVHEMDGNIYTFN